MANQLRTEPKQEIKPPLTYKEVPLLHEGDAPLRPLEWFGDVPLLYEDEEGAVGESNPHITTKLILLVCVSAHFAGLQQYQVFADLNIYYPPPDFPESKANPNVAPDTMVVQPYQPLDASISS